MTQLPLLLELLQFLFEVLILLLISGFFVLKKVYLRILLVQSQLQLVGFNFDVGLVLQVNLLFFRVIFDSRLLITAECLQLPVEKSDLLLKYALVSLYSQPIRIQIHSHYFCHYKLLVSLLLYSL